MAIEGASAARVVVLGERAAIGGEISVGLEASAASARSERGIIALAIDDPARFAASYAEAWNDGACPLVINPALPEAAQRALAEDAGARAIVRDPGGALAMHAIAGDAAPRAPAHGHLLCTSGTMGIGGMPKVYFFEAAAPPANARAHHASLGIAPVGGGERVLLPMPITHSFGLVAGLHGAIALGAHLFVFAATPDPSAIVAAVREHAITTLYLTPTLVRVLFRALERKGAPALPSLRRVSVGSAPMTRGELLRLARALPGVAVFFTYGLTEMGPRVSTFAAASADGPSPLLLVDPDRPVPIGAPIDGVRCAVVGEGDAARLAIASPYGARGRWRRGAIEPIDTGASGFVTEDAAVQLPSGDIELRGRADGAIISGGLNIYPEDIERVALAIAGVAAACAVGKRSPIYGEVAVLVCEAEREAARADLERDVVARLGAALPASHVPKEVVFVDALPRTPMGKVARKEVAALVASGGAT
jgi:long-chain acyl-CoA synthetase